ncbi:MAG: hypothetical protein PPFGHCPK_01409 (plasmid) [Spiroplasma endosymbiont of Drosophila atripex]|nr:MAG: hypothetical protein PPFGHCPK_01409 [Spiroplasma endosymbiont of Drosophila atripex]
MNWTIFFAIIILLFIFWKPILWLLRKIMFLLGFIFGFFKRLIDLKNKKLNKGIKGDNIHDDISNK